MLTKKPSPDQFDLKMALWSGPILWWLACSFKPRREAGDLEWTSVVASDVLKAKIVCVKHLRPQIIDEDLRTEVQMCQLRSPRLDRGFVNAELPATPATPEPTCLTRNNGGT